MDSTLIERLRALKEQSNLSPKSNNMTPYPLESLLYLYVKCRVGENSLYINNFEGLKTLIDWLGPIHIPRYEGTRTSVHWYEVNYEINMLSKILNAPIQLILDILDKIYGKERDRYSYCARR